MMAAALFLIAIITIAVIVGIGLAKTGK